MSDTPGLNIKVNVDSSAVPGQLAAIQASIKTAQSQIVGSATMAIDSAMGAGFAKAQAGFSGLNSSAGIAASGVNTLGSALGGMRSHLLEAGVAIGVLVGAFEGIIRIAKEAQSIQNNAMRLGVSTEQYQRMAGVAQQMGIDPEAYVKAKRTLEKQQQAASTDSTGSAAQAFQAVNLNPLAPNFRSIKDLPQRIMRYINEHPDDTSAIAASDTLLGRGSMSLRPLASMSDAEMKKAESSVTVQSPEVLAANAKLAKSMVELNEKFTVAAATVVSELAPDIEKLFGDITKGLPQLESLGSALVKVADVLVSIPSGLITFGAELYIIYKALNAFKGLATAATHALSPSVGTAAATGEGAVIGAAVGGGLRQGSAEARTAAAVTQDRAITTRAAALMADTNATAAANALTAAQGRLATAEAVATAAITAEEDAVAALNIAYDYEIDVQTKYIEQHMEMEALNEQRYAGIALTIEQTAALNAQDAAAAANAAEEEALMAAEEARAVATSTAAMATMANTAATTADVAAAEAATVATSGFSVAMKGLGASIAGLGTSLMAMLPMVALAAVAFAAYEVYETYSDSMEKAQESAIGLTAATQAMSHNDALIASYDREISRLQTLNETLGDNTAARQANTDKINETQAQKDAAEDKKALLTATQDKAKAEKAIEDSFHDGFGRNARKVADYAIIATQSIINPVNAALAWKDLHSLQAEDSKARDAALAEYRASIDPTNAKAFGQPISPLAVLEGKLQDANNTLGATLANPNSSADKTAADAASKQSKEVLSAQSSTAKIQQDAAKVQLDYDCQINKVRADRNDADALASNNTNIQAKQLAMTYSQSDRLRITNAMRIADENTKFTDDQAHKTLAGFGADDSGIGSAVLGTLDIAKGEADIRAKWASTISTEEDSAKRQSDESALSAELSTFKTNAQAQLNIALNHAKTAHDIRLDNIKSEGDESVRQLERFKSAQDTLLGITVFNNPWIKSTLQALQSAPDMLRTAGGASSAGRNLFNMGSVTAMSTAPTQHVHVTVSVLPNDGKFGAAIDTHVTSIIGSIAQQVGGRITTGRNY